MATPNASPAASGNIPAACGEVSGAFILGLVNSFLDSELLPANASIQQFKALSPTGWYPYAQLTDAIDSIRAEIPRSGAILFQAGMHFIRLWYDHGPGKTMIHSGLDWLYANQFSGGYNSVVRGGTKEEIGWCRITKADEENGVFVYENVMPLSPEYVRGVFYGGCLLFGDMEFVDVSVTSKEYPPNPRFISSEITVRFRLKPPGVQTDLTGLIDDLNRDIPENLSPLDAQRLVWRFRSMEVQRRLNREYFNELSSMLVATNKRSLELAESLRLKIQELNATHERVTTLEGLLHICAWCKRMQEDDSSWVPLESYVCSRTTASFTHSICPDCAQRFGKT